MYWSDSNARTNNTYNPDPDFMNGTANQQNLGQKYFGNYNPVDYMNNKTAGSRIMGGATGALGGAATGAAVGSVVPVVGTTIGAIIGALLGGTKGAL